MKIAIVASKFNEFITQRLLKACLDELARLKVAKKDIVVTWVPGSYEIPVTAVTLAKKKSIHAVICLGCIIRGETFHFELVTRYAAKGIMDAAILTGKPVIFGVLATDTVEQANKRAQEKGQNKGRDAAVTAVEMVNTLQQINS